MDIDHAYPHISSNTSTIMPSGGQYYMVSNNSPTKSLQIAENYIGQNPYLIKDYMSTKRSIGGTDSIESTMNTISYKNPMQGGDNRLL